MIYRSVRFAPPSREARGGLNKLCTLHPRRISVRFAEWEREAFEAHALAVVNRRARAATRAARMAASLPQHRQRPPISAAVFARRVAALDARASGEGPRSAEIEGAVS